MNRRNIFAALAAVVTIGTVSALPVWAGISGQPKLSAEDAGKFSAAARLFNPQGGDPGKGRADLLLLIEAAPTADFTDYLALPVSDDSAYNGIVATLSDALATRKADDPQATYLLYNIARTHYLRALRFRTQGEQRPFLEVGIKALDRLPTSVRDTAAYELRGDIEAFRGNTDAAVMSYKRMTASGGTTASVNYKIGLTYLRANRLADALASLESAARAASSDAAQQRTAHYAYVAISQVYYQQGNERSAIVALGQAAKVKQDTATPFNFRLEIAQLLLRRGHAAEVAAYAEAAVRHNPDDEAAKALLEHAKSARR
jgi:tetratricopeptide (TPR) repeat protein